MPRLFCPMDIPRPTWETDPLGNSFCAGGLMLTLTEKDAVITMFLIAAMVSA